MVDSVMFSLDNFPNPFSSSTTIRYQVSAKSNITIEVYNSLGERVVTLVNRDRVAGKYEVNFDAQDLPSGIYIYRMLADGILKLSKRMVRLK